MDIKCKTCDIWTWEKHLFLSMSFTNTDTLVPSLYQCIETRSVEVFWLLPQPLPHLVGHNLRLSKVFMRMFRQNCEPLYATNTSHGKQETFLYECPFNWVLLPTKKHNIKLLFGSIPQKHGRRFDYWDHPLNLRMRVCYLDCHEGGLCCYLVTQKPYYVHYSCFTSICVLFTDSLS
jgi:hypothetical protein